MEQNEDIVVLSRKEYEELLEDSKLLARLRAHGVDNWYGYEDALEDEDEE